jgi:hypothetical protein
MKHKKKMNGMSPTKKHYLHKHKSTWKPPKSDMTPAQFHRDQRDKVQRASAKHWLRLELYECPDCHAPKGKFGYCTKDRRWAVRKI